MAFTDHQIRTVCELKATHTAREVAQRFGVSRNAIIGIWHRNKHLCVPISKAERAARQSAAIRESIASARLIASVRLGIPFQ